MGAEGTVVGEDDPRAANCAEMELKLPSAKETDFCACASLVLRASSCLQGTTKYLLPRIWLQEVIKKASIPIEEIQLVL